MPSNTRLDQIPTDFQREAKGKQELSKTYDLGRTPTNGDLLSIRLQVGHLMRNCEITVVKNPEETVTVTAVNARGWTLSSSTNRDSPTAADDQLLSRRQ